MIIISQCDYRLQGRGIHMCEISPMTCLFVALDQLLYKKYANHVFPLLCKNSKGSFLIQWLHHRMDPSNSTLGVDIGPFSFYI